MVFSFLLKIKTDQVLIKLTLISVLENKIMVVKLFFFFLVRADFILFTEQVFLTTCVKC